MNTPTPPHRQRVAVVGGGWAGLSAAVRAASDGHHVTVFEASRQWGGRARSVPVALPDGRTVVLDNGQHILIGAYTDTLRVMQTVGVDLEAALLRTPLALVYPDGTGLKLPAWGMPPSRPVTRLTARMWAALLHRLALPVVAGVWQAQGWSGRDKLALLTVATRWQLTGFRCAPTTTVAQLCAGLPPALASGFIDPLCVSALNTPADRASGQVFLRVLKDALFGVPGGADLLLPRVDLSTLFPQAAVQWLTAPARGATLHLGTRVTSLHACPAPGCTPAAGTGVQPPPCAPADPAAGPPPGTWGWLVNGQAFDRVVLAFSASKQASSLVHQALSATVVDANNLPACVQPAGRATPQPQADPPAAAHATAHAGGGAHGTATAGQAHPAHDWAHACDNLAFEAIATVYAWCTANAQTPPTGHTHAAPADHPHLLPQPMTALRSGPQHPAQFVFDRSWLNGPKGLLAFVVSASQADAATLAAQVCAQAAAQLGLAVSPLKTIVEKRATFACTPGLHRPHAHIATQLVAAGDHIAGPYPATLEGAVRSGWYAGGPARPQGVAGSG